MKDPKASVKFYEFLGLSLLKKLEFPDNKFGVFALTYSSPMGSAICVMWMVRSQS